mgnify:CR=1 FL=1
MPHKELEVEVIVQYIQIAELRKNLSDYLDKVENGELVVIKRHKKPIAVLTKFSDSEIGN